MYLCGSGQDFKRPPYHDTNDTKSTKPDIRTIPMRVRVASASILTGINRRIQMRKISMFADTLTRHAPATPGRTALVGHWLKNGQTGRLEWHWSLEAVYDEPEEFSDLSLPTAA
jgi:hypothetical protein